MELLPVKTAAQIAHTAALAKEIWTEHFTPIIGAAQVDYMLNNIQSENAIAEQIQNKGFSYYLLQEGNQTIGYCAVAFKGEALFLSKLYILKPMRGKGIARQTLEYLKAIAEENGLLRITLTVNKYNTGTITAYEKLGFINTGPLVQDIGGGFVMDDYTMTLDL